MSDNLLQIDPNFNDPSSFKKMADLPMATSNPYDPTTSPNDILELLPPDGSMFGLYSDPYATMVYYQPKQGNHTGKYWLNNRLEEHSFTENEIALIDFLSIHRVATRNQIHRVVFKEDDRTDKVRDFIQKCRKRGIITAFSWITPCIDGKKKPLIYGLTRVGCEAAQLLLHRELPKEYMFQPVEFTRTRGPQMAGFFYDLVNNELYSELKRIDRVISWERKPSLRLNDGTTHRPGASVELIKDRGEFLTFWIDTIRLSHDWYEYTIKVFKKTQLAFEKLPLNSQPKRVIVIVDSDSRIPYIGKLAEEYMPSVPTRFTTDERLLMGLSRETFLLFESQQNQLKRSPISFLTDEHEGMTATEYFESQSLNIEDEDDFED
ncbi:replication-relaxation family protein [Metabacillus fastidiosus]|uniref:Replication-relaxation family protein n=1 Tax=Metabacillus fastidiosus TaxID=1458 RepID=A0ABU6NT38_9BACI|nr:replication-relaxation family protein [Metabacillus fastidiosus]MED4400313.1 replication-relaxation family protein [Metabacillus fastidiosus]